MRIAARCGILVPGAGVYPSLKGITALAADDPAGEAVAILVFIAAGDNAFFSASLMNQGADGIKVLPCDDCLVVVGKGISVFFSTIGMAVELGVRIGFLEDYIAGVLLVGQHATYRGGSPASSLFAGNASFIQCVSDCLRSLSGKNLREHPAYNFGLLRIDHHLLTIPFVAVWRIR